VDFLSFYSLSHRGQLTRWTSYPFIYSAIEVNQHGGLLSLLFTQSSSSPVKNPLEA